MVDKDGGGLADWLTKMVADFIDKNAAYPL